MRQKSAAQEYLEQYEMLFVQIECRIAERQQWHDLSFCITQQMGGERVQSSGNKSKMTDAYDRCIVMEGDISEEIAVLSEKQEEIKRTLAQLDNPTEYKVLHQKYIQFKQLKEIAGNFNSDYTWATTVHGRALKSVEAVLTKRFVTSCD